MTIKLRNQHALAKMEPGTRFGRLVITQRNGSDSAGARYDVKCDCGTGKNVRGSSLRNGATTSCGCLAKERATTHGMTNSPEHQSWRSMKDRCYRKGNNRYKYYGARGIKVCDRWKDSFANFFVDMGARPEGHTLDRIDTDGDYTPDNCKWSTVTDQNRNRRGYCGN